MHLKKKIPPELFYQITQKHDWLNILFNKQMTAFNIQLMVQSPCFCSMQMSEPMPPCWAAVPSKQYICSLTSILNIAYKITFRQRRSHSVPRGIRSPHTRSAPVVSDIDAPPSAAPFLTPLSLLSPSLKPGTESEPGSITQQESVLHACLHADL